MRTSSQTNNLRRTGINAVGDIPWGSHFCHFYETKQDLLDILVPYFRTGLEDNEFCLWVISEPLRTSEATQALRETVPDIERHLATRSIEIITHNQWYLDGGTFDGVRVINSWKEKLEQVRARGYAGMRVHGNVAWLTDKDWKKFLEYEQSLNDALAHQQMIALCTYPLSARNASEIFDVAHAHQVAIAKRHGHWEMLETPEIKQTKTELAELTKDLERRVHQRTSELAAVNQQLRLVIDTIPAMAWIILPDGTLDFINQRWLEYTGLSLEEALEQPTRTIHPKDLPRVMEKWRRDMAAGEPSEDEMRLRRADGEYRWFLIRTVPLLDEQGNILKWYGTSTDIEDRKRAEEALREAQAVLARVARATVVGELTASIAHEVNQPLGAVVTNADAALRWLDGKRPNLNEAREALQRIVRDGNRASEVVARIRALLKDGTPIKNQFNLGEVIAEVVALTEAEAQQRKVSVQTRMESNLPRVTADRVQVQQVLMNLMMNALDALEEIIDRPRVLTIRAGTDSPNSVRVAVQDTGIGVDRQQAERLFRAFFTTKPNGLGMGLAISRSIIEAHGGRLWMTPNDGPGVTFQFALPVKNGGPT